MLKQLGVHSIVLLALLFLPGAGATVLHAQEELRCVEAERFLTQQLLMVTRVEPDTLDDWRTSQRLPGCRITAAGARRSSLAVAARVLYEKVRAEGWMRTPDPRDAPNESSLRFRIGETDCLFNVYQGILMGTDAELAVTGAVERRPGEELYHVVVWCLPAMEVQGSGKAGTDGVR